MQESYEDRLRRGIRYYNEFYRNEVAVIRKSAEKLDAGNENEFYFAEIRRALISAEAFLMKLEQTERELRSFLG